MPLYTQGRTRKRIGGQMQTSILDIDFENGLWIYVFPGAISPNNIWVKFRDANIPQSGIRTPSHIHWAVDILIKKFVNRTLADEFLNNMMARWEQVTPLADRKFQTILDNLKYSRNAQFIAKYRNLNTSGFFNIEFLTHLMELLMLQEKTNNPQAYMFRSVIDSLLQFKDLYKILSTAGYRGRR